MLDSSPEDEDFPGRLLHQAALWDNAELLEDLLHGDQQAHINSQDNWGRTPLHAAAITENSNCLRILLNSGADPNIQCGPRGENRTALHLSAEHGHDSNVKVLLEHNASLLIRDANGMTAFDIADKSGHSSCMMLLKEAAGVHPIVEVNNRKGRIYYMKSKKSYPQCSKLFIGKYYRFRVFDTHHQVTSETKREKKHRNV